MCWLGPWGALLSKQKAGNWNLWNEWPQLKIYMALNFQNQDEIRNYFQFRFRIDSIFHKLSLKHLLILFCGKPDLIETPKSLVTWVQWLREDAALMPPGAAGEMATEEARKFLTSWEGFAAEIEVEMKTTWEARCQNEASRIHTGSYTPEDDPTVELISTLQPYLRKQRLGLEVIFPERRTLGC